MIYVYVNELFEEGDHQLTAGKKYEVLNIRKYNHLVTGEKCRSGYIIMDDGYKAYILIDEPCAYLGMDLTNSWIVEEV